VRQPESRVADIIAQELDPLRSASSCAHHIDAVLKFLARHERMPAPDDALAPRLLRARAAVLDVLTSLRDAYARFDARPIEFELAASVVRRAIEEHTFAPETGNEGVHLIDAASARFGDFANVQLAGLVDGEWPDTPRRNIFYPPSLLRELGWSPESERLEGIRGSFVDLLRLPSSRLVVSNFTLEDDAIVAASPLVDDVAAAAIEAVEYSLPTTRMFDFEALALAPVDTRSLGVAARRAAARRLEASRIQRNRPGFTNGHPVSTYSVSALERYQDCGFKFFAADVLGLGEPLVDEPGLSSRARGRFVHEVFQRFFEEWDARGHGAITFDRVDEARTLFEEVAMPLLARFPAAEAALVRARLFGSAVSTGIVDAVIELEASRPATVRERWLECRLDGEFSLGMSQRRRVSLKGVADRIDLLEGDRIRVIDYKSGYPPNPRRALQAPVYALCAQERLSERDGKTWSVEEAAYVAFSGKRRLVPVVRAGATDTEEVLGNARDRLLSIVDGIARGEFMPNPYDPRICSYCAYPSVCRKDYVGDELGTRVGDESWGRIGEAASVRD
jgi:RecB family exonuclease